MNTFEELIHHQAAVTAAASAVDAARVAHDADAEMRAVVALEAASRSQQAFFDKLRRATSGDLETYDPVRAPGRRFWDGDPR